MSKYTVYVHGIMNYPEWLGDINPLYITGETFYNKKSFRWKWLANWWAKKQNMSYYTAMGYYFTEISVVKE